MADEPDIIKKLKEEEKLGLFEGKAQGVSEEIDFSKESLDDASDRMVGFVENKDFNDKSTSTLTYDMLEFRPQWQFKNKKSGSYYRSGIIPRKLFFSALGGNICVEDAENAMPSLEQVFREGVLTDSEYIRIADYSDVKKASINSRKYYAATIARLNREYNARPVITYICGASPIIKTSLKLFARLVKQKFIFVSSVDQAFEQLNSNKKGADTWRDSKKTVIQKDVQKDIDAITAMYGNLLWDEKTETAEDSLSVSLDSPLYQLAESLVVVRNDLQQLHQQNIEKTQKLEESEEKYRSMINDVLDASQTGIFVLDSEFKVVWINHSMEKYFGFKKENIIGKDKRQLIESSIKDIFEDPDTFREEVFATYDNNTYIENFECHVLLDGKRRERWLEHRSQPIKSGLYKGGLVEYYTDITKRKRAEEEIKAKSHFLESLIQQSPLPTFVMDSKGFNVIVNEAFLKFYAVPDKKMILGRNALTEPANVSQGVVKYFEEALNGKLVETPEIEFVSPYENKKTITRSRMFPIVDPTGALTNVVVMQEDITEHKQAEEALKLSNENFQQVVSNITIAVWKADIGNNGAFENTYTSPVVDELLELPAGTIQNDWNKYLSYIKPEYLERVNNAFREAIMSPSKKIDCEYEVLKNNGQTAWFYSKGRCFEKNGKLHVFGSTTDITERKKAEELLKIHTKELEILNKIITSGNKAQDLQSLLVDVLDAVLDLMDFEGGGIGLVDETTRTAELVCHKGLPSDFVENVKQEKIDVSPYDTIFVKGQPIFADNYSRVNSKRSEKWGFLSVASIPLFAKGKVVGALNVASKSRHSFSEGEKNILRSIGQEIGTVIAKMRAEETLDQSEKKFQEIFNGVSDAVFIHDIKDRSIIDVNDEACRRFGYTKEEIKKMSIDELSEGPVSLVDSPESKELFKRIMNGELVKSEWLSKNKDGDTFWHEMNLKLVELEGKKRLLAVARDITDRKKSEEKLKESESKFRELSDLLPQTVFESDINGVLTFVNKMAFEVFGYTQEDFEKGVSALQFLIPEDRERGEKNFKGILRGERLMNNGYIAMKKDGGVFPIVIYSTPIIKSNKPIGLRGFIVDITEQDKAEKTLKDKLGELERYKKVTVGRELQMIKLKDRIKELEK